MTFRGLDDLSLRCKQVFRVCEHVLCTEQLPMEIQLEFENSFLVIETESTQSFVA